jgi:hypothetical protein
MTVTCTDEQLDTMALTTAPPVRAGTTVRAHIVHLGAIGCSFRSAR